MNITFHRFLSILTLTIVFTIAVSLSTAQSATITAKVRDAALNQDSLKLKVFLSKQPGHQEALTQKEVFQPQFNRLSNQVQELIQPFVIGRDAIPQAIRARLKNIHREHDTALDDMRRAIYAGIKPQIEPQQSRVVTFITDVLKGEVYAQVGFVNTLGVKIPSTALNQLANHPDVARISKDHEGQLDLDDTAKAIGTDHLWNIGYDGNGVWDVAVIDSGVTINHPGLRAHKDGGAFYSTTGEEYADDDYGHGTAVAGIIASTNSTYKGVAPGIDKIIICKVIDEDGPISETEVWDAADWALDGARSPNHETADIINLSLSWNNVDGYSESAQFFDAIVHDLHVTVVKSAGNKGSQGITVPGEMYNGLTVANMDNRDSEDRTGDVAVGSSSQGKADGRKKPDVIAPGKGITTARRDYDTFNTPDYGTWTNSRGSGSIMFTWTSFAASHVTGAIAVL